MLLIYSFLAITVSQLKETSRIGLQEINATPYSLECLQLKIGDYVIRNQSAFDSLLQSRITNSSCQGIEYAVIDFDQQILIGVVTSVAGCSRPGLEVSIHESSSTKLIFDLSIKQNGLCKINFKESLWYLIPKQYEKLEIEFNKKIF